MIIEDLFTFFVLALCAIVLGRKRRDVRKISYNSGDSTASYFFQNLENIIIDNRSSNVCSVCSESIHSTDDEIDNSQCIIRTDCDHHYHKECFEYHYSGPHCSNFFYGNIGKFFFCLTCNRLNYIQKVKLIKKFNFILLEQESYKNSDSFKFIKEEQEDKVKIANFKDYQRLKRTIQSKQLYYQ